MNGESKSYRKVTRAGVYQGEWNDVCPYCGEKQLSHRWTIEGPDDELFEQRIPCLPQKESIKKHARKRGAMLKFIRFLGWAALPFIIHLVNEIGVVARIAMVIAVGKLLWETTNIYGRPEKWWRVYGEWKKKQEEQAAKERHFIYHCERNPEGFRRLMVENLRSDPD